MTRRHLPFLVLLALLPAAFAGERPSLEEELARAKELRKKWEVRAAEEIYAGILAREPDHPDALVGAAHSAASVGEHPRAEKLYRRFLEVAPDRPEGFRGLAGLSAFLDRREEAAKRFGKALEIDPADFRSLAGLAEVRIEQDRHDDARALLDRAEELAPDAISVLGARSEYAFRTGDMPAAVRRLRRILEKRPLHVTTLKRISNGFIEDERIPREPRPVPEEYAQAVADAVARYRALDFEAAEAAFAKLDGADAPDSRPAFYRGLIAIRTDRLREAEAHLERALAIEPDLPLVQNAYAVAMSRKLASQRAEYGGGPEGVDRLSRFVALRKGPAPERIAELVVGYERLLPGERLVIDAAARPFADRLPILLRAEVTHEVLDLDTGMAEAPSRRYLFDRRTVDGRWYGGVRGVGGRDAATGIESVMEARDMRYDTFAHELAHQVHRYGLPPAVVRRIAELHAAAKSADRCLDYYAASNEWEYFAQGYEAFVSVVKSPFHHYLRRHTRAELRARDPALYDLIREITGTPEPDPALRGTADGIRAFYEWSGDATALQRVLALLRPHLAPATPDDR